jgi:type II secretory pathway pseudopilin PulG
MDTSSPAPDQSPNVSFGSGVAFGSNSNQSKKKLIKVVATVIVVVIVATIGLYVWALWIGHNQAVEQARQKTHAQAAAQAEAKAKEGTVSQVEAVLSAEFKQTADLDNRSIFATSNGLQQETTAAMTTGAGNEDGL